MVSHANIDIGSYLVLIDFCLGEFSLALLLERDNYQRDENIHKKERKHNEVNNVEERHVHLVARQRPMVDLCDVHGVLQNGRPAFARLHREQSQNGEEHVVVVELPAQPAAILNRRAVVLVVRVELALARLPRVLRQVGAVEELALEDLNGNDCEDECEQRVDH